MKQQNEDKNKQSLRDGEEKCAEKMKENGDDLCNPITGETRRSEEKISKEIKDDLEAGGGFEAGGGQPFTG